MTVIVAELYEALKSAGIEDGLARKAAASVIATEDRAQLATKADLADLKTDLIRWVIGLMLAQAAIVIAAAGLLMRLLRP